VRRVLYLKPATVVIDDHVETGVPGTPARWLLHSHEEPSIEGRTVHIAQGEGRLACETLLPPKVTIRSEPATGGRRKQRHHRIEVAPEDSAGGSVRFLHVLEAGERGTPRHITHSALTAEGTELTVATAERTYRIGLAAVATEAGSIEIAKVDGFPILGRRLLPSGILPYGPGASGLLERWDSAYRGGRRPGWDTGRPSTELRNAVEAGTLRPCRAVVLGCGTGTHDVYLAGKGFEVTGIDIAPTALELGRKKAEAAGVKVTWMLADVLALPKLEPFDCIFDRGCYHAVRRTGAPAYRETIRRISRPGTLFLLIAGNANEGRAGGPPRVTEAEIRGDFGDRFTFEWFRTVHFDTADPDRQGALAWSVLMRRT
jgi:SAM-dependent methyltransferase